MLFHAGPTIHSCSLPRPSPNIVAGSKHVVTWLTDSQFFNMAQTEFSLVLINQDMRFKDSSAVWRYSGPDRNGRGRISCDFKAFFYQSKKSKKGWQWKLGARNPYTILCKRYARKEESINESWVIWLIWKNANQHPKAKQILLVSKLASAILSRLLTWKILWCLSFYRCLFPW